MGAATAYYLSELGLGPVTTVVEREGVACAASGVCWGRLIDLFAHQISRSMQQRGSSSQSDHSSPCTCTPLQARQADSWPLIGRTPPPYAPSPARPLRCTR